MLSFRIYPRFLLVISILCLIDIHIHKSLLAHSLDVSLLLGIPVPVRVLGYRGDSSGFSYRLLMGFDTSIGVKLKDQLRGYFGFSDGWIEGDSSAGAGSLSFLSISIGLYGRFEKNAFVFRTGAGPVFVQLSLDVGGTDHLDLWMYGVQWRSSVMYVLTDRFEAGIAFFFEWLSQPWNRSTYFNKALETSLLGMIGISGCWYFL